ncbi:unnamed protein product [Rotaria sordida]|uniref:RING-type domain-containing protein n=1 Tax=Rotaria sordida TaxID=392033 RepID=A0A818Y9B1_9BILA|nr:unnamed protein product [Rotaria sordida]CAF0798037.1 unnamed protein product [Rotaria sordida]CAF0978963.1 unnamed protein product [Rotaria sordida]CAF0979863.1 unnamed protein product [Rotaria sordida]CAF1133665.1 unnamed protein product [Rotaria sordida]
MGQRMTRRQVDEGLELYAQKNYDAAIKKWTTALPKMKDNRLRFSTLGHLASASRDRGRNKDYLVHAVQQIDIAHELDDNVLRAQAYLNLSRANEMLADYFKAVSYSRLAIQYSQTTDSIQGYALLVMADSYIGLCNFPKVLECLDKSLYISHESEDHLMEIQVLNTMGKVFLALKDFPKALAFQRRAHELALSNAVYAGEQNANISAKFVRLTKLKLATPLRLMGDLQGATKCVEEAMRSASSLGDRPVQAKCLVCLGDIQRSQNNNEVACKKYEAAIQMLQDMNDRYSSTLAMLGLVKTLLAPDTHTQMASEILATALSTATSMGNKLMQARCHLLNERILTSDNQLEDARQAFEIAQRLYREIDLICTICKEPMGMYPDQIQILTCTHIFHERCILNLLQRWTYEAQSCPKCNKSVLHSRSYIALSLF